MTSPKYFIYVHKPHSQNDRKGASIAKQLAELTAFAQATSLSLIDVIVDDASEGGLNSPRFDAMLRRVDGGEASAILTSRPDLLAEHLFENFDSLGRSNLAR